MPKPKKVLTKVLYVYVRPSNRDWIKKTAKAQKKSYSEFLDETITRMRTGETPSASKAA